MNIKKSFYVVIAASALAISAVYAVPRSWIHWDSFEPLPTDEATAYLVAPVTRANVASSALDDEKIYDSGKTDANGKLEYVKLTDKFVDVRTKGGYENGNAIAGELHAVVVTISPSPTVNITPLSDIAYRVVRHKTTRFSERNLWGLLNTTAKTLIKTDINGDEAIDYHDILAFNPTKHQANLNFDYSALTKVNDNGDSIIGAYRRNDEKLLTELLGSFFRGRINFNLANDSEVFDARIALNVFGDGEVTSTTDIVFDSDKSVNKTTTFVFKNEDVITFTAKPKDNTKIYSWEGCESVSSDLKTCTTNAKQNRLIQLKFAQKTVETVKNLVIFDNHPVTISGDKFTISLDKTDAKTIGKADDVKVGTFIVGTYERGYLYRVTSINRLGLLKREFTVEEAGFEDIIVNGTAIFEKQLSHADLKDTPVSADGKYYRMNTGNPKMRLLTASPDSTTFTVGMIVPRSAEVVSACSEAILEFTIDKKLSQTSTELSESAQFGNKGCFKFGNHFAIVPAYSFEINVDLSFDVSWGRIKGVRQVNKTIAKELFLFKLFAGANLKEYKKTLFSHTFDPGLNFAIGIIPVNITPQIKLEFKSKIAASAAFEAGAEFEQTNTVGFDYRVDRNPRVVLINDSSRDARFAIGDDSKISIVGQAGIDTAVSLLIYRAVGPSIGAENNLEMEFKLVEKKDFINPCDAPPFTVKYKLEPYVSIDTLGKDSIPRIVRPFVVPVIDAIEKYKDDIKFKLFPWEHTIYSAPSLFCDNAPAQLDVAGNAHKGNKETQSIQTETYTITNTGGNNPLKWYMKFKHHPAIAVKDTSGKTIYSNVPQPELGKKQSTTVTVSVDYSKVPYGKFDHQIEFVKKPEGISKLVTLVGLRNNIRKDIDIYHPTPVFPAPTNLTTQVTADNTVYLKWQKPAIPNRYRADLVKHYRLFVKENCKDANSEYQLFQTIPNVFGIVDQFLYIGAKPNTDYCFAVQSAGDFEQSKLVESPVVNFKRSTLAAAVSPEAFEGKPTTLYLIGNKAIAEATVTIGSQTLTLQQGENTAVYQTAITFDQEGNQDVIFNGKFADGTLIYLKQTVNVEPSAVDSDINWITSPLNGHQYTALDCGTWTQCEAKAVELGGHLVTIRNAEENQWLINSFINVLPINTFNGGSGFKIAWIGLHRSENLNDWKWSSEERLDFLNWGETEPNNAGSDEKWVGLELYGSSNSTNKDSWLDINEYQSDNLGSAIKWGIIEKTTDFNTGLIAHYKLDGNANDASGNGLHGVIHGNMIFEKGVVDKAGIFDGIDDYIEVPHTPKLEFEKSFTISLWVWLNVTPSSENWGDNKLISKSNNNSPYGGYNA